jgi:hypothetical protein
MQIWRVGAVREPPLREILDSAPGLLDHPLLHQKGNSQAQKIHDTHSYRREKQAPYRKYSSRRQAIGQCLSPPWMAYC